MRQLSRTLALVFALGAPGLPGCYSPDLPRDADAPEPRSSRAQIRAHGTENGEVSLADLATAHGLEVKIDKVTGRRFLTDGLNKVVVAPGTMSVTINGTEHPLNGEIRWKNGQIVLPGDARVVFGDQIKRRAVPNVGSDPFAYLDLVDPGHGLRGSLSRSAPVQAPVPRGFALDPSVPPIPASWNVSARRAWTDIVIHHSATHEGGARSFGRQHQRKWENGLGYHFVIGNGSETRDGEVEVGPRWLRQNQGIDGAHAGVEKYNKHGIGVCLVGDFDRERPTPKQMAALRNLVQRLMARYGIKRANIVAHRDVRSGHTECPGTNFPLAEFLKSL